MTAVPLKWEEVLMPLLQKYKLNITWGDQDLLNILFYHNPESLYVFPCQWNYRPDHCMYGSNCQQAEQEGVFILHGNRGVYHTDKQPAFRAIYEAIQKYPFGENMEVSLLQPLEAWLQTTTHTYCGRASHLFTKKLKQSIKSIQQDVTQKRWWSSPANTSPLLVPNVSLLPLNYFCADEELEESTSNRHSYTNCIITWWKWRRMICGTGLKCYMIPVLVHVWPMNSKSSYTGFLILVEKAVSPLCPGEILDFTLTRTLPLLKTIR